MAQKQRTFFRSTTFLRILIVTGIILLLTSLALIYFVFYGESLSDESDSSHKLIDGNKPDGRKGEVENYHEKWKGEAKVINIGKPQRRMMYFGTNDLEKEDKSIERIVFTIHGLGRNAAASYEYAKGYYNDMENTAIIAPSYTGKAWQRYKFRKVIKWDNNWPLGVPPKKGEKIEIAPKNALDSFNVLDYLTYMAVKAFVNANEIVFIGFSAGAQLLQRYLASSPYIFELWNRNFHIVSYLTSPGDYMYFNQFRANNIYKDDCYKVKSIGKCFELVSTRPDFWVIPTDECNGTYNTYKFGLENLNYSAPYVSKAESVEVILSGSYLTYPIYYLVGGKDKNPPRSRTCAAMLQGTTRLQRMILFLGHVKSLEPEAPHVGIVIPGCQHSEYCIGTNPETKKYFLPGPVTKPDRSGNLNPFNKSKYSPQDQDPPQNSDSPGEKNKGNKKEGTYKIKHEYVGNVNEKVSTNLKGGSVDPLNIAYIGPPQTISV